MSSNQRIYDTIFQATRNVHLFQPNTNMQTLLPEDIRQLLPQHTNYNSLSINRDFLPKHTEFTSPLQQFLIYTSPNNLGIFSCFAKKLREKRLVIYPHSFAICDKETGALECFIDFASLEVNTKRKNSEIMVIVEGKKKETFLIYGSTPKESDEIDVLITDELERGNAMKKPINYLCAVHNYSKYMAISLQQFERISNTGDILLFKNKPPPPKPLEAFQIKKQSPIDEDAYQHVAIVVRNRENQILVVEKNQKGGIGINYWLNIVNKEWYRNIDKIVYRKLEFQRTEQFYNLFEIEFIKALDKQFKTDLLSIYNIEPDTITTTFIEDSPFKCGDFVAQFYNKVKLISIARQSIEFWPNDFTAKREFPFLKNQNNQPIASFGPESIVLFNPKLVQIIPIEEPEKKGELKP